MKKIKFKYIFLYIILIFLAIFVFKNRLFLDFSQAKQLISLDLLKEKPNIEFGLDFTGDIIKLIEDKTVLKDDKINLLTLSNQLKNGEEEILNKNIYDYRDYYNLGNINFLKYFLGFKSLKSDDKNLDNYKKMITSISFLQNAIKNYKISLDIIPHYKKKDFILENLNFSKKTLDYSYQYFCNSLFYAIFNTLDEIFVYIQADKRILKTNLEYLKKWETKPDLKTCAIYYQYKIIKKLDFIEKNELFFKKIKPVLLAKYDSYFKNIVFCYQDRELLYKKYFESLNGLKEYILKLLVDDLMESSSFSNEKKFREKCLNTDFSGGSGDSDFSSNGRGQEEKEDKKSSNSQNQTHKNQTPKNPQNKKEKNEKGKKIDEKIKQYYQNLSDLLPPPPQKKESDDKQSQKSENEKLKKPQEDKKPAGKRAEIQVKDVKKYLHKINQQMKFTIEDLQKIKTKKDYSGYKYIKELFKEFYGNDKELLEEKKQDIGK